MFPHPLLSCATKLITRQLHYNEEGENRMEEKMLGAAGFSQRKRNDEE